MRFRRAASLVATFEQGGIVLQNFLTRERFACSAECLKFLSDIDEWHTGEQLFAYFPDSDRADLADQLTKLVSVNILIVEGSQQARQDELYRKEWLWGASTGFYHFSTRDTRFVTGEKVKVYMRSLRRWRPSPALLESNAGRSRVRLPKTDTGREPFAVMHRRRSRREFDGKVISKQALADCLFAGNGVVEFRDEKHSGRLPITMTPSGGARNPFELYVYARRIAGIEVGFYHYDALKHDIGAIRAGQVAVPPMLATQKWPAKAAAIIFLVANFKRTMWKYHMPLAYRVVMMEAGFIGQNIALAATHHGLSAVPSGALNTTLIEGYLGVSAVEAGVILSLNIGRPVD